MSLRGVPFEHNKKQPILRNVVDWLAPVPLTLLSI